MDGRYDDEWVCGRWCWLVGLVMIVVRPRVAARMYRVGLLFPFNVIAAFDFVARGPPRGLGKKGIWSTGQVGQLKKLCLVTHFN